MNWLRSGSSDGSDAGDGADDELFDAPETFVPEHLPEPGSFLREHDVLVGDEHVHVHGTARELFEEFGVYDVTFGYNLARLNLDTRHPDAGFRYAEESGSESDDERVLRAEFTPTTAFCPQSDTLTRGAFRAWNASDDHDYDLVRVRVSDTHQTSEATNRRLAEIECTYRETGSVEPEPDVEDPL